MTGKISKVRKSGSKASKKIVVMAFGAFDGVYPGHLYYLRQAKKLGDRLIVAIARDNAVWKFHRQYKLPENERLILVRELGIADKVELGSNKHAFEKVKRIRPDIIAITPFHPIDPAVLGADLRKKEIRAKVVLIPPYKKNIYNKFFFAGAI